MLSEMLKHPTTKRHNDNNSNKCLANLLH